MKTDMYCYLEGRDRKTLPSGTSDNADAFEKWLDPDKSAVVCIDMHRGHVGPADEDLTCPAPSARAKIPAHNMFHRMARAIGVPIIHVQHWQRHGGMDDVHSNTENRVANWRLTFELFLDKPVGEEHSWEGTKWLDVLVEEEESDYYVRTKKRLSGFYPTDLEFLLRQLDVDNVVLTGTYTDACVLSTAFDAANRDFRVTVLGDIVAGGSEENEAAALMIVALHCGLVTDGPALIREWYARKGMAEPEELIGHTKMTEASGFLDEATATV
ncbi:MAG: nicotinamidase-related amidase [Verrucomicrobiales bacterium]|jgi:nicotinamidase-related amidase